MLGSIYIPVRFCTATKKWFKQNGSERRTLRLLLLSLFEFWATLIYKSWEVGYNAVVVQEEKKQWDRR